MKKGFLLGLTVGGVAAFAAYQALSEEKKEELHDKIRNTKEDLKEQFADYALYAEDLIDDLVEESDFYDDVKEKVQTASDRLTDKKTEMLNKFNQDDFDDQTTSIREQLSAAMNDDDIIIDKTDEFVDDELNEETDKSEK
ncbi:hypothetical protein FC70_GL000465 [Paucilactobacillus oligofermentans DSM 15707 = LMG 22743]|uniref:YtxH domain-containing protein n=1 Tax=Paucilactobacillus oligofermentans DSM 15707 = LMG 22743 TaxID=1423778 RepID=A0A0R1RM42_9LACO|nr:YtxH domain-containing protein [Paucilactobacillus oligofermentans]KRL57991.1 hypothetical protein FC70_GL000465 [Paucilactobacillus oligofermentans DSM 15707 = LMG 22743]CUS26537.1 Uncharacterized protein LACOL_1229 [Paucilactobacillus oligofermentans DSM 15707 = LMG 22743]